MLTVRWTCPGCSRPLALSRQLPTWLDVRISLPGPLHSAADTEAVCLADVWVILEGEEQEGASDAEIPFSIQVWQVVRRADAIDAPGGGLQDSAGE